LDRISSASLAGESEAVATGGGLDQWLGRFGLFRDFHESLLNELYRPRHGVGVDPDAGKQVGISPTVRLGSRAAELDLHTAFHQASD